MRFTTAMVTFLPIVVVVASEGHVECLVKNSKDIAEYTDCGHQGSLAECLAQLNSFSEADIRACYTSVGCSASEAWDEAEAAIERCKELAKSGELKRRFRAVPAPTVFARADSSSTAASSDTAATTGVLTGSKCLTTWKHKTSSCDVTTSGKHVQTNTCVSTEVDTSSCDPTMICTIDSNNDDICMKIVRIDVAGIIITLVFAGVLVIGSAALTWACCKDRKQQKRLVAKAEAVALARAATKKQRAAQRQPLIRNPSGGSGTGNNPFQDQARV